MVRDGPLVKLELEEDKHKLVHVFRFSSLNVTVFMCRLQVVILERRNGAGKVLYKPLLGGWNGSEEDKHRLLEELERLQKDPSILTHDAILPELNNEFASVSPSRVLSLNGVALNEKLVLAYFMFPLDFGGQGSD